MKDINLFVHPNRCCPLFGSNDLQSSQTFVLTNGISKQESIIKYKEIDINAAVKHQ
jgi:hypothetical protein